MPNPSLIGSPQMTTKEDVVEETGVSDSIATFGKPSPINTSPAAIHSEIVLHQVTPTRSEALLHLFEGMDRSINWKCKRSSSEATTPHPVKRYLQTECDLQSLKELLSRNYADLKELLHTQKLQEYPLCLQLFLFSLCAAVSGLRSDYHIDPFECVAKAWCSRVSGSELKEACLAAVHEFLFLYWKNEMGEERKQRLRTFWNKCRASMTCPSPSAINSFPECNLLEYIDTNFSGKSDCLFRDIFPGAKPPTLSQWDTNTKMFLFGILSLCADGRKASPTKLVGSKIAGCGENTLRQLYGDEGGAETLMEKIEESVGAFNESTLQRLKEVPMTNRVSQSSTPQAFPRTVLADYPQPTDSEKRPGHKLIVEDIDEKKVAMSEQVVIDYLKKCLNEIPARRSSEIQQLLETATHRTLQEKKGKNSCICEIVTKCSNGRKKNIIYAHIPESKKDFSLLGKSSQNFKANILVELVNRLAGDDADEFERKCLVSKFLDKFGSFMVFLEEEFKFTMQEIAVIRSKLNFTLNQLNKLSQYERALKGRYPTQFKKKYSAYEKEDIVPQTVFETELNMNGNKGTAKVACMEVTHPSRLLERMLKTTMMSGAFRESQKFSSLLRTMFVSFGCDKDSDQTSMMMRVVNRAHGNSSHYVGTLAMYEEAKECYENLKRTILRKDGPTQPFLQKLVDNKLFALRVSTADVAGELDECEFVVLNLFEGIDDSCEAGDLFPNFKLELQLGNDENYSRKEFEKQLTYCANSNYYELKVARLKLGEIEDITDEKGKPTGIKRFKSGDVEDWSTGRKVLKIFLVTELSDDTLDDSYYGYRLYEGYKNENNDDVFEKTSFFVGLLEKPVRRKFNGIRICDIQQIVGIHSADMKNSWNIKGMMDGPTAACSCHICTQPKNTYEKDLPRWLRVRKQRENPTNASLHAKLDKMQDYGLREGIYSNKKMHQKFIKMNGGRKFNFALSDKRQNEATRGCLCCVNDPLLHIHPSKENMGALRLSAGMINHFKDNVDKQLMEVDTMEVPDSPSFLQEVQEAYELCKTFLADKDGKFKECVKKNRNHQKDIESYTRMIERGYDPSTASNLPEGYLQSAKDELESLKHAPEIHEYRKMACLRKGAKELVNNIDTYRNSKKAKGQAQSIFRRAIQMLGTKFNAQHGGMELSNAAGMVFLGNFREISAIVKDAYELECETRRKKV